jgi:hypothetical protein
MNSCSNSEESVTTKEIEATMKKNYYHNPKLFEEIYDMTAHFKYIGSISFLTEDKISIHYAVGEVGVDIKDERLSSKEVRGILQKEDIDTNVLLQLKNKLNKIDCSKISLFPHTNRTFFQVEIFYTKSQELYYNYRVYPEDFDTAQIAHFKKFIVQKKTGGILGNRVLWYYR